MGTTILHNSKYARTILPLIETAKSSIEIIMYEWRVYSNDTYCDVTLINQSLLRAKKRGVTIRGIVNNPAQMIALKKYGLDIKTNEAGKLLHTKFIVIDSKCLFVGSHNITNNAMKSNIETSVCIMDTEAGHQFSDYFKTLWSSL